MARHWWNRRTQSATTGAPDAPKTDQDALSRQAAAIASYGRALRGFQIDGQHHLLDGEVYVCGVGSLPVSLTIAAADLADARQAHTAAPDDPTAAGALERAETEMGAQLARRRQAPAPTAPDQFRSDRPVPAGAAAPVDTWWADEA